VNVINQAIRGKSESRKTSQDKRTHWNSMCNSQSIYNSQNVYILMVIHLMVNVCIFLKFIFLYVITIMRYPIYSYINFKVSQVKSHSLVFQVRYV